MCAAALAPERGCVSIHFSLRGVRIKNVIVRFLTLQSHFKRNFLKIGRMGGDILRPQQALVKGEQGLVDFKYIVVLPLDEKLDDNVEFVGVGEGKPGF